jgi:hypothetical protein
VTRADVRSGLGSVDHHVWIEVTQRAIDVATVKGVVHAAQDLDVLLPHPLRIIALRPRTA